MPNATKRHINSSVLTVEVAAQDLDPYLIDETTLTLDDWNHRPISQEGVEVVRLHQHHTALLVA